MTDPVFPAAVPRLDDGTVALRAHTPEDVERIVEQASDPDMQRWTTVPRPYDAAEGRSFLSLVESSWNDPGGVRMWAISTVEDDRFLGTVDLRPSDALGVAEIGFGLHPDARGRGVMAAAVRLACQWWFDGGGTRVHWRAARGNFPSWRVAWACGFTHHGILPGVLRDPDGGPALDAWLGSLGVDDVMEPRTPWPEAPVLETDAAGGLRLREWRDADIDALEPRDEASNAVPARGVLDADTFEEWLLTRREKMSVGTTLSWCVADAASDRALGEVLLFVAEGTLDDDTAELGYQVLPSARRRGVATEAARLAVRHAFTARSEGGLGLRRLVAETSETNTGSNRVLDEVGFEIWGRESDADVLPGGTSVEAVHWELLRPTQT